MAAYGSIAWSRIVITETQIAQVITAILGREGGFVDDPQDSGGRTNFGITQTTADDLGLGDVADLTYNQAFAAYRRMFADWRIDQMVEFHTFALIADACVNHGSGRAVKWLQEALGIVDDGVIGPQTLQALEASAKLQRGSEALYASILSLRIAFYGAIIGAHPYNAKWAHGWLTRAASFLRPWPFV